MKKEFESKLSAIIAIMDSVDPPSIIREVAEFYQDKFDNFSERTQESERGETIQELIDHLEAADDAFDEAYSELEEALEMDV